LLFNKHGKAPQGHTEHGEEADPDEMTRFQTAPLLAGANEADFIPKVSQVKSQHSAYGAGKHPAGRKIQEPQTQCGDEQIEGKPNIGKPTPTLPYGNEPQEAQENDPVRKLCEACQKISKGKGADAKQNAEQQSKNGHGISPIRSLNRIVLCE